MTVDMGESWLRELGEFFNVPVSNAGVPGSLTRDAIAAQNRDSTREAAGWKLIVWTGHNDINKGFPSEVIPGIRTLTNKANGNYLVMGLTTGLTGEKGSDYYNTVCAPGGINSQLAAEHGPRFFNSHRFLVDKAMASLNMTPTAQDKLDIANDIPPDSLRADAGRGHLNERGQQAIANALHTLLK